LTLPARVGVCVTVQGIDTTYFDPRLIGAVFFESSGDAVLIGDPAYSILIEPLLDWAELLAFEHNCLSEMGYPLAAVQSWSESIGANKVYQKAGLLPHDKQLNWVKA
jgi:hypothetical protein